MRALNAKPSRQLVVKLDTVTLRYLRAWKFNQLGQNKTNYLSLLQVKKSLVNPFTPKSAKLKTAEKIIHVANVSKTNSITWKYCSIAKVHLSGHTLGIHPETQKLQPLTQGLILGVKTLGVKGLNMKDVPDSLGLTPQQQGIFGWSLLLCFTFNGNVLNLIKKIPHQFSHSHAKPTAASLTIIVKSRMYTYHHA